MFENHSGSILPWEWRILDCEHGIVFRESQSASERTVAMHILGATANRAVRILGDVNFASVPILIVIRRTERRWTRASRIPQREMVFFASASCWA